MDKNSFRRGLLLAGAALAITATVTTSCKTGSTATGQNQATSEATPGQRATIVPGRTGAGPVTALPKACVFQMNGDYADHVMVSLSDDGKTLTYYPGVGDLGDQSAPRPLGDGFYLCRQGGVGTNSRFLSWTFKEYRQLKETPSPAEILSHILPEARVTYAAQLPVNLNEALSMPDDQLDALIPKFDLKR